MPLGDPHAVKPGDGIGQIVDIWSAFSGASGDSLCRVLKIQFAGENAVGAVDDQRVSRDCLVGEPYPDAAADLDRVVIHLAGFDLANGVLARGGIHVQRHPAAGTATVQPQ